MLASDDIHLGLCFSANSLWSTRYFKVLPNVGRVKSSVDDLTMERGTVSMRVAFVLRSAEVQPLFRDLCDAAPCLSRQRIAASSPPFVNKENMIFLVINKTTCTLFYLYKNGCYVILLNLRKAESIFPPPSCHVYCI